jgi:hypothetical protein
VHARTPIQPAKMASSSATMTQAPRQLPHVHSMSSCIMNASCTTLVCVLRVVSEDAPQILMQTWHRCKAIQIWKQWGGDLTWPEHNKQSLRDSGLAHLQCSADSQTLDNGNGDEAAFYGRQTHRPGRGALQWPGGGRRACWSSYGKPSGVLLTTRQGHARFRGAFVC